MSNKVIRICAIVIVVLLAVALVAFISINVVRESKKANFYLVHNGTQITENVSGLVLERGTPEKFEIAYFEGLEEEKQGYYVTVETILDGNNFYFKIQGQDSSFYATRSDVTDFFDIEMQEEYFTITLDEKFKATDVIEWVYSDKRIYFPEEVDCSKSFYKIVVHLEDGTAVYNIGFRCEYTAEGIRIDENTAPDYFGGGFSEDCNINS
ncbi:MAG: hypothetical protein J6D23_07370 [Clostridia bacterium]|nr:hypothetical protein [Clostridia bacterium]